VWKHNPKSKNRNWKQNNLTSIRLKYLGNMFSDYLKDIDIKLQTYNKLNVAIKRNFGKQMETWTKLKLHNITSKPALTYGSETWVMNKRDTQRLEAAQMRFLRPLLGYKRLDRQRNEDIRKTLKVTNIVKEIQQHQKRLEKSSSENGQRKITTTSIKVLTTRTTRPRTTQTTMERPSPSWVLGTGSPGLTLKCSEEEEEE
jgi:hypothetical protein